MRETSYANLTTLETGDGPKTVVLLHGYGADHRDLAPLAPLLGPWRAVFPCGQVEVPIGPHMTGRAWFAIDMMRLQMIQMSGRDDPYDDITPPGLPEAAALVKKFLDELAIPASDLILGGFSQGSMVALETALQMSEPPAGLALLSSARTSGDRVTDLLRDRGPQLSIYQSHGANDPVLPVGSARRLADLLKDSGASAEYHEFPGEHEIPMPIIKGLAEFIDRTWSSS